MRPTAYIKFSLLRPLVLAGAVAVTVAGFGASPARADDWDHGRGGWRGHEREHEWREHEWREHEWREHHGWGAPRYSYAPGYYAPGYYVGPRYYYPPPTVVYPPPVYVPPAGLNLGFYFR
ncbi:MAG TPA: hypothetical protein VF502_07285 [Stellaceae bacterium]